MSNGSEGPQPSGSAAALQTTINSQTQFSAHPMPSQRATSASSQSTRNALLPVYSESSTSTTSAVSEPLSIHLHLQRPSSGSVTSSSDIFFDIVPRNDSTSFQVGYLGLKGFQAWLKGDVLVKLDTETNKKGRYTRCLVKLQAVEKAPGTHLSSTEFLRCSQWSQQQLEIELFSHTLILWDADNEATCSSGSAPTVPSTMPFSFPLTEDLPHCVHLRDSFLSYTITAQLFSEDAGKLPHAIKTVPVHLVRYTRPGPLNEVELGDMDGAALPDQQYTLQPYNWIQQAPTLVYAQINRTIFRRAEPIDIRVRIPPPDPTTITEKGLKLRSVEADLVRIIQVKRSIGQSASHDHLRNAISTSDVALQDLVTNPHVHQALLAHSGKLCRFHSQRPVLLRLTLHPPFDRANMPHPHPDHDALASGPVFGRGGGGGCESISQETLMHKVSFEVRIKIGILGGCGEHKDIVLRRAVRILPGAAGALEDPEQASLAGFSTLSEKERLKRSEKARMLAQDCSVGASSSRSLAHSDDLLDFDMDDEYDGYEDVGRSLNDLIDAVNQSNAASSSSQTMDHAERLEQLRQFLEVSDPSAQDDGPPPSLLESRNDLQVEVEVEGEGLATPHHPHCHPTDRCVDMDSTTDGSFPPPPPIDDPHPMSDAVPSSYAVLSLASDSARMVPSEHDDPPPPLSPAVDRSGIFTGNKPGSGTDSSLQTMHSLGDLASLGAVRQNLDRGDVFFDARPPPAFLDLSGASSSLTTLQHNATDSHPSYEAAISDSSAEFSREQAGASQYEPPPYIDGSSHADPVPSFDQAVRHHVSSGGLNLARSTPPDNQTALHRVPLVLPQHATRHSHAHSRDHGPPAYGTSPHPPSYDA